ncbi:MULTISPECIES: site-specific DNA-methyltransferase [unclassified Modicisalibacter]|uniref:site-specific DNA-methyltransferase n=1 Tax=unclassified Modicisalibacter TaxID=2679913 RepID=UPI001CC95CAF|nr:MULTISPECIES: site-specific DNA-methyltransferase [unclassified Modicisalibacter]MBZ9557212.1 site-specific DNA-methyltransferase [Modicisalibacter sp. R2A 31.J]MBZ9574074.1 site-specific DNA-methyltransferase [Modicisalibacter sp. MOD 31.J]
MARKTQSTTPKSVESLTHDEATRRNIPTAEYQSVMRKDDQVPVPVSYPRGNGELREEKENRNPDLDPQLVWRGKDQQDWSDLVVHAPPLYIQEKVHPKVLIDDLRKRSEADQQAGDEQADLFADFNGVGNEAAKTEFYQHDAHWTNRMILGDSLQVMASLAEREGLRGKVQCIYLDPPYGIKFNSNFQWSTTSRDVIDGSAAHITREPEMVKAFRDTWRDGINTYLSYLRDRLTVARDLLTDSGSIFVQIGDENVHRVRAVMDEVFGEQNFCSLIAVQKTSGSTTKTLPTTHDYIVFYAKNIENLKYRKSYEKTTPGESGAKEYKRVELDDGRILPISNFIKNGKLELPNNAKLLTTDSIVSKGGNDPDIEVFSRGIKYTLSCKPNRHWKTQVDGIKRLWSIGRLLQQSGLRIYKRYYDDFPYRERSHVWNDTRGEDDPTYVVQTHTKIVERCLLMATDPGDLVLDPTCGSGTTATVAEQWGRRWITIDTSRVALALARARIMGARYPYYLLADSRDGQLKEAEITRSAPSSQSTRGHIGHGFVYQRAPHITLKDIASNTEIDVIWESFQKALEPLRERLNDAVAANWEEWEIPRQADEEWPEEAKKIHARWWEQRIARQQEIDASIAAKADQEFLYDKPYEDKKKVRVAGPFTVESLSPHRVLGVDENDELIDPVVAESEGDYAEERDFVKIILENLKTAGVQQAHKEDRISFTSLTPWPGDLVCAEGRYVEGDEEEADKEKRAAIFIGPEFGTVSRPDLVAAAREAGDADFDVLIACAFNYDAHSSEFEKLGRIPVLKARMNADLHMADDLKNTGKGNLFVIFGEPDIDILDATEHDGEPGQIQVKVNGVDVFHPNTGEVRSDGAEGIACWFIDTDYNEESFFVRQAYFLGANDPYKSLKTTLKAEIDEDAWATLHSDTSRPFARPKAGRIAVKVINHLGDEVMKVFRV